MALIKIIVIHRSPGQLADCLAAIRAFTGGEYRLVVIDATHGQDRKVEEHVRGKGGPAPQIVISNSEKSTIKTLNSVLMQAQGHQVFIVESIVRVVDGWIKTLGSCLDWASRAGLVGPFMDEHYNGLPREVCSPTTLAASFGNLNAALQFRHKGQRVAARNPWAGCLAGELATVRALGGLDAACQDIDVALADLCLRAEMAGYQNYLAGDIFVVSEKRPPVQRWQRALRDMWESRDPESEPRKHYEALNLCHRANQAYMREESDAAIELYLKGIGLYPRAPKLYLDLATLLAEAGQYADALEILGEMPEDDRLEEKEMLTGICQLGLGQTDEVDRTVGRILATDARSAAGWWLKGACLADRGAIDQSRQALNESIACDPGYGAAYALLGKLSDKAKTGENVLELIERGFALSPTSETAADYHTVVSREQAYQRAIPFFTQALVAYPSSGRLRYLLIDLLLKAGEQTAAMDVIESMLAAFGVEEGLLNAALAVRAQLGPRVIPTEGNQAPTLAFCLIVKNEERDLPRCLESIKAVADEIVVVDTGSQDRTRDVAQVFGARVFDFKWFDDFSAARNFAAENTSANWIFSIDADEVVASLDHRALRELVNSRRSIPVAYSLTTRNYLKVMDVVGWETNDGVYPEEAGLGWIPSEKVRLYPKDRRVHFVYPVHEMVEPSLEEAGIPALPCNIPVHHYGKLDYARSKGKGKAYFDIGIKKLEAMRTSATGIRELAIQAQTLGDYKVAVRLWKRLMKLSPGQAQTYLNLGSAYHQLGQHEKAQEMASIARKIDPTIKESHFNLALSLLHTGDALGAVGVMEGLVVKHPEYIAAGFLLAVASCCAGDIRKSREQMKRLRRNRLASGLSEAARSLKADLKKAGQNHFARAIEKEYLSGTR